MAFKKITALALAAGIAMAASGCNLIGDQIEDAVGGGIEEAVEGAIENQTGSEIDLGSNVDLPSSWPGLPTPDAVLSGAVSSEDGYYLQYTEASDAIADDLIADYQDAGFTLVGESDLGFKVWTLESDEYNVSVGLIGEDGDVALSLTVSPKPAA